MGEPTRLDLGTGATDPEPCGDPWPCPPRGNMPGKGQQTVFVALRYAECETRPVRVHPAGCGCDGGGCERSRTRESFELAVLWQLPQLHIDAQAADVTWRETVKAALEAQGDVGRGGGLLPVPPCPACGDDPVGGAGQRRPSGRRHRSDCPVRHQLRAATGAVERLRADGRPRALAAHRPGRHRRSSRSTAWSTSRGPTRPRAEAANAKASKAKTMADAATRSR